MIDAEQTYLQYAIDSIAKQLQRIYNKETVVVMNTYQGYLKRTKRNVKLDVLGCKMLGVPFSAKLVRGAYVTEENNIALEHEVESPVLPNKALVDKSYNAIVDFVIANMPQKSHFAVASHNEQSIEVALGAIEKRQKELADSHCQVSFGQLKGLGDKITYRLAEKGYFTFKYLPFGPTHNLIPYLFRRAEEASYIWLEGGKKLVEAKKEIFQNRKLHIYAGAIAVGSLVLLKLLF